MGLKVKEQLKESFKLFFYLQDHGYNYVKFKNKIKLKIKNKSIKKNF